MLSFFFFETGHQTRLYITFEHKPNWTKLSIDDEIPVALAIRHIKAMMEPFQIEFGKVISYDRWNGTYSHSYTRPGWGKSTVA